MIHLHEKSAAFREALLKSESLRIRIVLAALGAAIVIRGLRAAAANTSENLHLWIFSTTIVLVVVAYELLMLREVKRAIRAGKDLPRVAWIAHVILETSLPAVAVAFLTDASIEPAYRPVANPATLIFFVFIILSTLRLNPSASRLSGFVAAASYLVAALYLGWRPPWGGTDSLLSPEKAVGSYAITMIVAGVVAGAVAGEIRKQVEAALREAETRRQLERVEHDLEVARSIQQSLLPSSMPQIEGFDIAGWNQPADQTGGDYYDWQPLADGKALVVLADVTGHGIASALLAVICRAYERSSFRGENGLYTAMERVNNAISGDLSEGRFVTFVAAVCGPQSPRVEMLSAGHGPLFFYYLTEDRFDAMDAQGLPLGISPTLISEPPVELDMKPGDLLVLTTDGFYEWANPRGEMFGRQRMEDTIRAAKGKPAREIISALYKAVIDFSGGTKQADDLTAIIIKRA